MTPRKFSPILPVVLLQLVFIWGMVYFHLTQVNSAVPILLETEPVDPLSVFRGRYISLNYKISNLPLELLGKGQALKRDDVVYVVLEKKEKFWQPALISKTRPEGKNTLFLRGKVYYTRRDAININYGIESFFLSEASANIIERGGRAPDDWRQRESLRKERVNTLSPEDKIIYGSGANEWWLKTLSSQLEAWVKENLVSQEQAQKIKDKYAQAWARINATLSPGASQQVRQTLEVEVAVTREGRGYPRRIFWEGKEYR